MAYSGSVGSRYQWVLTGADTTAITYRGREKLFYEEILGREMNIVYDDLDMRQNDEYKNMPTYPDDGYCKMIGDKVIVKIN